ncbi:Midasin [Folsomia candida]|uniref:Midasin n=1 Tax=Folsomia candida TaxID=158441 RepID=A0A226E0G2_FOLCA|nr:Midasin [Folsomia candida]
MELFMELPRESERVLDRGGAAVGKKLENLSLVPPPPRWEMADIYRRVYDVTKHLVKILQQFVKQLVLSDRIDDELIDVWSSLKNLPNLSPEEGLAHDVDEEVKRIQTRADFLQTAYLKCKSFAESESRNLSMSSYENKGNSFSATTFSAEMGSGIQKPREQEQIQQKVSKGLKILGSELEQIYTHLKAGIQTGSFQWIDSKLIKSMENGEWLLIDGANRCSAAVLDRLNSLLEPNGSILLSERGSIDGNILEIKPDPEFRLILTVDPAYGEISRAMRNRGVEIYMGAVHDETFSSSHVATSSPPPGCETNDSEGEAATVGKILSVSISKSPISPFGITFFDLDNLLRAEGLKDCGIRKALINLHTELTDSTSLATDSTELSVFRIVSSTKEIVVQLQQGISLPEACQRSLSNWYMSGNFDTSAASGLKMRDAFKTMIQTINSSSSSSSTVSLLPVALQNFVSCDLYRSWKHLETLEWGLGQLSFMVDNQCGRKFTKDLVEDFLILSVVSRVIRQQDVRVLSIALGLQYPLKASFVNKLATILESEEFESFIDWEKHFWDIQEQTDIINVPSMRNLSSELYSKPKEGKFGIRT